MKPLSRLLTVELLVLATLGMPPAISGQSGAPAKKLKVVVFGGHPDDPESGAGGLVAMLTRQGHELILAYGTAFRGNRRFFDRSEAEVRREEATAACKVLGATPKFFPYAHEKLVPDEPTLKAVASWLDEVKPDIVVTHWPLDTHPNHHVVGSLVWQSYKRKRGWNLYFFEVMTDQQTIAFRPELYLDIGPVREVKKRSLDEHRSQEPASIWEVHDRMHRHRGAECGVSFAEAYSLVEAKEGCSLLPVTFLARTGVERAAGSGSRSPVRTGTMIENQSRWIEVEGGRVHYLIEGDEKGRPVVLLHGARFQAETWKQIGTMKALAQAGYKVIAVDLPGYGKSAPSQGSPRTWLRGLLDLLKVERPVVVSPSMSGRFSLPLVTEEPQRVSGFVAVAPVSIPDYTDQLDRITAPVLAIWGEHDEVIPQDQADLLVGSVKRGRKAIISGAGHAVYMIAPAAFHKELLRFLRELP
jgi:LmbE family N-acetylglucosaminyl deacetylase/alpha-beta hydrolase superfamily lysophospholipase